MVLSFQIFFFFTEPSFSQYGQQKSNKLQKYAQDIIILGTIGGHNPLCLKSYEIRYSMMSKKKDHGDIKHKISKQVWIFENS